MFPRLTVLPESARSEIFSATLKVLEDTGVEINHPKALSLLSDNGARIDGKVARLPGSLVKKSLESAPEIVSVFNREGKRSMELGKTNTYFGTGSDTPNILDTNQETRRVTRKDVGDCARVADYLENIDFVMSLGLIQDQPTSVADLYQFQEMLFNTVKPIVFTAHDRRGTRDIFEMASMVAGGEKQHERKPFIIHYIEPTSPLRHSKEAMDKLLFSVDNGIPVVYTPAPSGGGTAPITLAGNIAQALAESLSGITVSQLRREGAPVITGGVLSTLDMKTSSFLYGSPELSLMSVGISEMSKFLDLPVYGTAGCTDSKIVDGQAAIEATFSIITQALSGANLTHDVGFISSGMASSPDQLVMSNEIIGMAMRFMEGIQVSEETLAAEVIDSVGHGGNYLTDEHTLTHFEKVCWEPELFDRRVRDKWEEAGSKALAEIVNEKTKDILANHEPKPLENHKREKILALIEGEEGSREVKY